MKDQRRAPGFGISLQRQHQAMGVDDAGGRRPQRSNARQLRLQRLGVLQPLQVIDAIAPALLQQTLQGHTLRIIGGDDQLAQTLIADAALVAVSVKALLALHAQLRLETPARVIDTGVDHFGIA